MSKGIHVLASALALPSAFGHGIDAHPSIPQDVQASVKVSPPHYQSEVSVNPANPVKYVDVREGKMEDQFLLRQLPNGSCLMSFVGGQIYKIEKNQPFQAIKFNTPYYKDHVLHRTAPDGNCAVTQIGDHETMEEVGVSGPLAEAVFVRDYDTYAVGKSFVDKVKGVLMRISGPQPR